MKKRASREASGASFYGFTKTTLRGFTPKRGGRAAPPARRVAGVSIVAKIFLSM
jgi:hypothetical protein